MYCLLCVEYTVLRDQTPQILMRATSGPLKLSLGIWVMAALLGETVVECNRRDWIVFDYVAPRHSHSLMCGASQCFLYGGMTGDGLVTGDSWQLTFTEGSSLQWSAPVFETNSYPVDITKGHASVSLDTGDEEVYVYVVCGGDKLYTGTTNECNVLTLQDNVYRWSSALEINFFPGLNEVFTNRTYHAMASTTESNTGGTLPDFSFVIFGGYFLNVETGRLDLFNDTIWVRFNPHRSVKLKNIGDVPSPRFAHSLHRNPVRRTLILFGGCDSEFVGSNDVYEGVLDTKLLTMNWTKLEPGGQGPSPRCFHAASMAPNGEYRVLGGVRSSEVLNGNFGEPFFNDPWVLSHSDDSWWWSRPPTTSWTRADMPEDLQGATLQYLSGPNKHVLFGGLRAGAQEELHGGDSNSTWLLDASDAGLYHTWEATEDDMKPASRAVSSFLFNIAENETCIAIYGQGNVLGYKANRVARNASGEMWGLTFIQSKANVTAPMRWVRFATTEPAIGASIAATESCAVVFGGFRMTETGSYEFMSTTATLRLSDRVRNNWQWKTISNPEAPPTRSYAPMASVSRNSVVLFGGVQTDIIDSGTEGPMMLLQDVWIFETRDTEMGKEDCVDASWRELNVTNEESVSPPALSSASVTLQTMEEGHGTALIAVIGGATWLGREWIPDENAHRIFAISQNGTAKWIPIRKSTVGEPRPMFGQLATRTRKHSFILHGGFLSHPTFKEMNISSESWLFTLHEGCSIDSDACVGSWMLLSNDAYSKRAFHGGGVVWDDREALLVLSGGYSGSVGSQDYSPDLVIYLDCPAGSYGSVRANCTWCPPGTYSTELSSTGCMQCPSGATSNVGETSCSICVKDCNSGVCKQSLSNEFHCECDIGYAGKNCEIPWLYGFLGSVVVIGLVFAFVISKYRKRRRRTHELKLSLLAQEQRSQLAWEIPSKDIKLIKRIASGSSAIIHLAEWEGKTVAVKEFVSDFDISTFEREVSLLKQLHHPHVLLFWGATVDPRCIITEYLSDGSLYEMLKHQEFSDEKILRVLGDICRGLIYLHNRQPPLIHRDLKAANILMAADGTAKVADFGISSRDDNRAVQTQGAGTTRWMAPETLSSPPTYSLASDIWGFGMIVYEVLARRIPYDELDWDVEVIKAIDSGLLPTLPPQTGVRKRLAELIPLCCAAEPAYRPTMKELHLLIELMWEDIDK